MRNVNEIRNRIEELRRIIRKKNRQIQEDYMEIDNICQNCFADIAINDITMYQTELHALEWVMGIEHKR